MKKILLLCSFVITLFSCTKSELPEQNTKGKLFIIGGGVRPKSLIQDLIRIAGIDASDYILIIPFASVEPDTAFFYAAKQFHDLGITRVINMNNVNLTSKTAIDSLLNSKLIYLTGGDQVKLMNSLMQSGTDRHLVQAYKNGTTIAGTSAGAAVQSKHMITGVEHKHPEYTGFFKTIEANNIEVREGLGLTDKIIVDQHFVKRMRMNRLISVAIENPGIACIGIDESTAIVIDQNKVSVCGESTVIYLKSEQHTYAIKNGLLGAEGLTLSVYLPGDAFFLED